MSQIIIKNGNPIITIEDVLDVNGDPIAEGILGYLDIMKRKFKGKKWCVVGDSITEFATKTKPGYYGYVANWLGVHTIYNQGKSGSGFCRTGAGGVKIPERLEDIPKDADIITVFAGVNDRKSMGFELGTINDTGLSTVYGSIKYTIEWLVNNFPTATIAFFTPLPAFENRGWNNELADIVKAIMEVCDSYNIPCLNLYSNTQLRPYVGENNIKYFSTPGKPGEGADKLHINREGHLLISYPIFDFMLKL